MKGIYLMLVTIYTYVFLATGNKESAQFCFDFTWPGFGSNLKSCTELNNNTTTPCIEPLFLGNKKPNLTEIWENRTMENKDMENEDMENENRLEKRKKGKVVKMGPGNICVKFTYMYNSAVVNISYFHGKVTEDQVTPIKSGCYVQYTEGYVIEVCACESKAGDKPCNSTIRNTHSALIIFAVAAVSLFMYKIFDIP